MAVALTSRHCLGRWFDDPDDLVDRVPGRRPEALVPFRFDRLRR
ncbi:hypothetical protein [Streptomyces sp. NPDC093598]